MFRTALGAVAVIACGAPAGLGLLGNSSFSQAVPVRAPQQASTHAVAADHGHRRHGEAEPGDDRGREVEPGDDRGREAEPGDDRHGGGGSDDRHGGEHGDDH